MALRFGLLGTGDWAARTHAAGLVDHPDARLVGVWGRDPARAADLAGRHGATAYADVDALLADVDAVSVALPPDVQAPLAVRAAAAGRHLLLDKPIALAVREAERLADAVTGAGVSSLVFLTHRYVPATVAFLDELVATGGWAVARVTLLASIFEPGGTYETSTWRRTRGGLWDLGPHALSLVVPVLGPVLEVTALAGPHATTYALLRHASGAVTSLAVSLAAPPPASLAETVFHGASGTRRAPDAPADAVPAYRAAVARLAANVARGGGPDPLDVPAGRDTVAVLAAVDTAIGTGARVPIEYGHRVTDR